MNCMSIIFQPSEESLLLQGRGVVEPNAQKFKWTPTNVEQLTITNLRKLFLKWIGKKLIEFELYTMYDTENDLVLHHNYKPLRNNHQIHKFPLHATVIYTITKQFNSEIRERSTLP